MQSTAVLFVWRSISARVVSMRGDLLDVTEQRTHIASCARKLPSSDRAKLGRLENSTLPQSHYCDCHNWIHDSRSPESVGQAAPVFTTAIQSGHRPPVLQTKHVPRPWVDLPILWRSNQSQVLETNLHVLIMASPLNSTSTSTACLWAHGICQGKIPRSWLNSEASKVKVVSFTKKKPWGNFEQLFVARGVQRLITRSFSLKSCLSHSSEMNWCSSSHFILDKVGILSGQVRDFHWPSKPKRPSSCASWYLNTSLEPGSHGSWRSKYHTNPRLYSWK